MNRVVQAFRSPMGRPERAAAVAMGPIEPLTKRELEVLGLIAAGRPNQEIADQLVVTLETVKKHTSPSSTSSARPTAPPPWPGPASCA